MRLPLLGTYLTDTLFEYLLIKVSKESSLIAIPKWVLQKPVQQKKPHFSLHLPTKNEETTAGEAELIDKEEKGLGSIYKVHFQNEPTFNFTPPSLEEIKLLVKDCLLIKSGMKIYMDHLSPFFSRIIEIEEEKYRQINTFVLKDIQNQIEQKIEYLRALYQKLLLPGLTQEELPLLLYLEDFRKNIIPEIDIDLIQLSFDSSLETKGKEALSSYSIRSYKAYLFAIKSLEKRLFMNYNRLTFFISNLY